MRESDRLKARAGVFDGRVVGQPATGPVTFLRVTTQLDATSDLLKVVAIPRSTRKSIARGQHESRDCPEEAICP